MVQSQDAAKIRSGEAVVFGSSRFAGKLVAGALLSASLLAACSPVSPPSNTVPSASASIEGTAPATARSPLNSDIVGLQPDELLALLGPPDLQRSEPPAQYWQYRSADCVLDIFLYREGGGYRVVETATRERNLAHPSSAPCRDGTTTVDTPVGTRRL
jgi:hypothetical protein